MSWSSIAALAAVALVAGVALVVKLWIPLSCLRNRTADPRQQHRRHSGPVRVLTWNVFLRSFAADCLHDNDFKDERLAEIVARIVHYDVVCLQEAFATLSFRVHAIIAAAQRAGFAYWVVPSRPPLLSRQFMDSGLLILSRFPVHAPEAPLFAPGVRSDGFAAKGMQYAQVLVPTHCGDEVLHLINCHTQSDYAIHCDSTWQTKLQQYAQIGHFIRTRGLKASGALLICADMNCNAIDYADAHAFAPSPQRSRYFDAMMECLGVPPSADIIAEAETPRTPTLYCHYHRDSHEEVDTALYLHSPDVLASRHLVRLPRSVDYMLFHPSAHSTLRVRSARVNEFAVQGRRFHHLSDHYAIEAELEVSLHPTCSETISLSTPAGRHAVDRR